LNSKDLPESNTIRSANLCAVASHFRRPDKIKLDHSHDLDLPFGARINIAPAQTVSASVKESRALPFSQIRSWAFGVY